MKGKEIKIKVKNIQGEELSVLANGKPIECSYVGNDHLEFTFIMPENDVEIEIVPVYDDPIVPPSLCLSAFEGWLSELTKESISEVKFALKNGSHLTDSPFVYIQSTKDKEIINEFLRHFIYRPLETVDQGELVLDGASWSRATFILDDGTVYTIDFVGGYYKRSENEYYDIDIIPTLMPYDWEKISDSFSIYLWETEHTVYYPDGSVLTSVEGLSELEFCDYKGDVNFQAKDCLYYIDTEAGRIYVCDKNVFMFKGDNHEPQCYELINGDFYEIFNISQN